MREIKFRVWNDIVKRYECFAPLPTKVNSKKSIMEIMQSENIIYEQYTGLKDKNGVEIYEGDIIKDIYNRKGVVEFTTEDVGSCGCCVPDFEGTGFVAYNYYDDKKGTSRTRLNELIEVIGNIHEVTK